jgi:L-cystine uptake protein TcyP (sodium:dicarboxylate symporter family)
VLIWAHQGGWDEILMVVVPLVLVTILLVVANKRAARQLAEREHHKQ